MNTIQSLLKVVPEFGSQEEFAAFAAQTDAEAKDWMNNLPTLPDGMTYAVGQYFTADGKRVVFQATPIVKEME